MHPKQKAATGKKNDKGILGVHPKEDSAVKVPQNASQGHIDPKESQGQEPEEQEEDDLNRFMEDDDEEDDDLDDFDGGYNPDDDNEED